MSAPVARLRVVSFLRESSLTTLRIALSARHDLEIVRSIGELDAALERTRVDVAIVDPDLVTDRGLIELIDVLDRHAPVRMISYTTVSPTTMRAQMTLAIRGYRHLVLRGFDDAPHHLRTLLEDFRGDALGQALLAQLRPALDRLPLSVAHGIEQLFSTPATVDSVDALTRLTGLRHRRRLYEALMRAGWQPAWILIRASRVVRAYAYLAQGGSRVRDIARQLGYATARGLAQEVRAVSGHLPSALLSRLALEEFLERVAAGLLRPSVASQPIAPTAVLADQSRVADLNTAAWSVQRGLRNSPHH